jgi:hypothetical protein
MMIKIDEEKERRKVALNFKEGWDRAGREGAVSPQLKKALEEHYGIHPDRAQAYMDAAMAHRSGRGPLPDPEDYKDPIVVPIRGKDKNPFDKK